MTTEAEHDQLYVYGIVTENTTLPAGLTGVSQGAVNTTTHGPLAAVVTHLNDEDELGTPDNLLAHSTVLDAIAEHLTILPMAFGTVAPSEAELGKPFWDSTRLNILKPSNGYLTRCNIRSEHGIFAMPC